MKKELNLWDLIDQKVYVKIRQPVINSFFIYAVKFAGSESKLANLLGIKRIGNIWCYKNGKMLTPLNLIIQILNILHEDKRDEFRKLFEENLEELRYGYGKAKSIKNPKLPIKFSPILSRIAGHLVGDGGIGAEKGNYPVYYTNRCDALVNQFKEDVLSVFGNVDVYDYHYHNKNEGIRMVRFPSIVGVILMSLFGPMVNELKHVPELVLDGDRTSKRLFLRALYDDEGCVSSSRIRIGVSNEEIIRIVRKMIQEISIRPGRVIRKKATKKWKVSYEFGIFGKNDLILFSKEIGFDHPEKIKKLRYLIRSYKGKKFRYKKGETASSVLKFLENSRSLTVKEIAKLLNRKLNRTLYKHLEKLEKEGIIKSIKQDKLKIYTRNH
jgi:intein/homing endonuclease